MLVVFNFILFNYFKICTHFYCFSMGLLLKLDTFSEISWLHCDCEALQTFVKVVVDGDVFRPCM